MECDPNEHILCACESSISQGPCAVATEKVEKIGETVS